MIMNLKLPGMRTSIAKSSLIVTFLFTFISIQAQRLESITSNIQNYEYQKAIDQIERIGGSDSDLEFLKLKAAALKGLKRYQEALPCYEKLFNKDTTDLRNGVDLANCHQFLGDYKKEQKIYHMLVRLYKDNNFLIQQLANSYYLDNDFVNAIAHYSIAYMEDSSLYVTRQLAQCFDNINLTDTAIFFYKKAIELNPIDLQSTYRLANIYKQKKEYKAGIALTDQYLKKDSTNVLILRTNGLLNFLDKDFRNSTLRFEKCITLSDTSDFTNKYLGYSYFKTENYEKAKDYLEKAFMNDSTNADLCYALGLSCDYSIYKKLGIKYLNKTVELMTPSPETLSQVYRSLANVNTGFYKYEDALEAYLKAYELTPNDPLLIYELAFHYDQRMNDKDKSIKFYQAFMATRPKDKSTLSTMPMPRNIEDSYYDFVDKRIALIKKTN